MSDQGTGTETQEPAEPLDPRIREQLREYKDVKAERDQLVREVAFTKAGVPTESPVGKLFVSGYSGDLAVDAVKAAWTDLGVGQAQAGSSDSTVHADLAAEQRIAEVASGGTSAPPLLEDAIANATTPDEVMAVLAAAPREVFRAR
jgi:hypothetical protein